MCRRTQFEESMWPSNQYEAARSYFPENTMQEQKSPSSSNIVVDGIFGPFGSRAAEGGFDYRTDNVFSSQFQGGVREKETVAYMGPELVEAPIEPQATQLTYLPHSSTRSAFESVEGSDVFGQVCPSNPTRHGISSETGTATANKPHNQKDSESALDQRNNGSKPAPHNAADHHDQSSLSYRQHTSELIGKLDKLLDFRLSQLKSKTKLSKHAAKKQAKAILKPRSRNVVLKQAVELIWRIQCDEQALTLHTKQQKPTRRDITASASNTMCRQPAPSLDVPSHCEATRNSSRDAEFADLHCNDLSSLAKNSLGYSTCLANMQPPSVHRKAAPAWWEQSPADAAAAAAASYFNPALSAAQAPFLWNQAQPATPGLHAALSGNDQRLLGLKSAWMADFPPQFAGRSW